MRTTASNRKRQIPKCLLMVVSLEIMTEKEHRNYPTVPTNSSFHICRVGKRCIWRWDGHLSSEDCTEGPGADQGADNCPTQDIDTGHELHSNNLSILDLTTELTAFKSQVIAVTISHYPQSHVLPCQFVLHEERAYLMRTQKGVKPFL